MNKMKFHSWMVTLLFFMTGATVYAAENIDPDESLSQYAWGENIGWINMEPGGNGGPGVEVGDWGLAGYMWGENIGWISLSCENTDSCGTAYFKVENDGNGNLSGYGWGENIGWINFAPLDGGVYIDACGDFNGTAWGENTGWISFRSDGENPFYIRTSWTSPVDLIAPVTQPDTSIQEWYNSNVNITLSATDCGSGVSEVHYAIDGGVEVIVPGANAVVTVGAEGNHILTYYSLDNDGNVENYTEVTFSVDRTPPTIVLTSPANGSMYYINQIVLTDYGATDGDGSGVVDITAPREVGAPVDTSVAGSYTFEVSATDLAGNTRFVAHSYFVQFPGNIDPQSDGSHYAYGENIGWINFKPSHGPGVTVTDSAVTGYAWSENGGWVNLSPSEGGVRNDGFGNLSGHAWAENFGWINFLPYGGGVKINPVTGEFSGHAWGENVGWISFRSAGLVFFGVKTSWVAIANSCTFDLDVDGDVDGSSLADIADSFNIRQLSVFAAEFGRTDCLQHIEPE